MTRDLRPLYKQQGNEPILQMCGICTDLYDPDTMDKVRHDGTSYIVKGDGVHWIGEKEMENVTYRCGRCIEGIPAPTAKAFSAHGTL